MVLKSRQQNAYSKVPDAINNSEILYMHNSKYFYFTTLTKCYTFMVTFVQIIEKKIDVFLADYKVTYNQIFIPPPKFSLISGSYGQ